MFESSDLAELLKYHPYLRYVSTIEEDSRGFVQWVKDTRTTGQLGLVKFVRRGHGAITERIKNDMMHQLELCHPHIAESREVFLLREYLCVLMELPPGGHLLDYLRRRGPLREGRARYYFQQLVLAVEYCHMKNMDNNIIALQNLYLGGDHDEILKLCDTQLYESDGRRSRLKNSTAMICYLSPESIKSHGNQKCDGKMADIWSCGVVLYAMVTGQLPFSPPVATMRHSKDSKVRNVAIARQILKGDYVIPNELSGDLRHLISAMIVSNPKDRITIDAIKRHPWFLKKLPLGAIEMNEDYIDKRPVRKQADDEIERIIRKAMKDIKLHKDIESLV